MRPPVRVLAGLAAALAFARIATAQEPPPEAAPEAAPAEAAPTPRKPKPRPKPRAERKRAEPAKADPKAEANEAVAGPATAAPPPAGASAPPEPVAHPATPAVPPPGATPFAAPVVACDPGKAVRYGEAGPAGGNHADLWVTRTGTVSVDNPLRPLTPDVTRVLQVVVGAKLATAYGPDLTGLRRGPSPGVLEGLLGAAIRWDASLGTLPETLSLVTDTGKPLADMPFRECGEAPAVKAPPPARKPKGVARGPKGAVKGGEKAAKAEAASEAGGEPGPVRAPAPQPAVRTPPGFNLPQGAIR